MGTRPRGRGVVVVSGASAGVGRATVREFARRGRAVALVARGRAGLEAAGREAEAFGAPALTVSADVSDAAAVDSAAERIEEELGVVDVWVNSAFSSVIAPFGETGPEEYERATDVCYHGYVNGTRAALARMVPRDRGVVVQVGSALAYRGIPYQAAYCGAKHAVRGFTDSVRAELLRDGARVRLTEVHLPAVNTPQFSWVRSRMGARTRPVPPVYQPEVAARAVVWAAAHPRRRRYWVAPSTVATVLGQRFAPRLVDHYLARTAYGAQVRGAAPPARDNLFAPVDAEHDFGAHGEFDDEARGVSLLQEANRYRDPLAAAGLAGLAAGIGAYGLTRGLPRRP